MAGALRPGTDRCRQTRLRHALTGLVLLVGLMLSACGGDKQEVSKRLELPERESASSAFLTDQTEVANKILLLSNDGSGCRLEVLPADNQQQGIKYWLKPMAPCYFIRSPGSDRVQVFQQDKTTRILAVVGTPVTKRDGSLKKGCGREVQGLLIDYRGDLDLAAHVLSGSVYCADKGLDNFQYSLFANQ